MSGRRETGHDEGRTKVASTGRSGGAGADRLGPRICLLGYARGFLRLISAGPLDPSIVVLEEPDLLRKRGVDQRTPEFPAVVAVHDVPMIGRYDHLELLQSLHAERPFDAVITVLEYAVPATALASELLSLPGAGTTAARTLCDKRLLRSRTRTASILNPAFSEVSSLGRVLRFAAEHGDRGIVLKPANRQASVGVQILDAGAAADPAQVERAWTELLSATDADHLPDREIPVAYLAESRLIGREVSAEALVADGRILWINQTDKQVIDGSHPVERRHVVPAELRPKDGGDLESAMSRLVGAVGFRTGVLHAEWILTGDGPSLVECAGRLPGDRIVELIDLAWGVDLCAAYTRLLAGATVDMPFAPRRGAAVVFLGPEQGLDRLEDVEGVAQARALPGVVDVQVSAAPGQSLPRWRSSWDRAGNVVATGATPGEAALIAEQAVGLIGFRSSDDAAVATASVGQN